MFLLNGYLAIIRMTLICFSIWYLYKRKYKLIVFTSESFALTFLPRLLENMFNIRMDALGNILYAAIIFMTIYLGNGLKFYDKFKWWDVWIHILSGVVFVSLGIAISKNAEGLTVFQVLFFSLTLSFALHLIWEVLEYIYDCIFHTDNQRWQKVNADTNHKSASAIQPAGLVDTMNDSIACMVSAVIACLAWWFVL